MSVARAVNRDTDAHNGMLRRRPCATMSVLCLLTLLLSDALQLMIICYREQSWHVCAGSKGGDGHLNGVTVYMGLM